VPVHASSTPHIHLLRGVVQRGAVQRTERRRAVRTRERGPDWLRAARRLHGRVEQGRAFARDADVHGWLGSDRELSRVRERKPLRFG
jgi:hypothetical protein